MIGPGVVGTGIVGTGVVGPGAQGEAKTTPIISLEDATFAAQGKLIVQGVTIPFEEGKTTALVDRVVALVATGQLQLRELAEVG